MKEKSKPGDYTDLFIAIEGILTIGFKLSYRYLRENAGELKAQKQKIYYKAFALCCLGSGTFVVGIYMTKRSIYFISLIPIGYILTTASIPMFLLKAFKGDERHLRILKEDISKKVKDKTIKMEDYSDPNRCPIGWNLKTNEAECLEKNGRTSHVTVSGPSGTGKSTFLLCLARHAVIHKHPLIFIDPKGSKDDLEQMKKMMEECGRPMSDLKIFSVSDPNQSIFYNPLKNGTAAQRQNKIMNSFNFPNEYYKGVAESFLSVAFEALEIINEPMTLESLRCLAVDPHKKEAVAQALADKAKKCEKAKYIYSRFSEIKAIKIEDLRGLASQLGNLGSSDLRNIISSNMDGLREELSLIDIIKNDYVLYFQVNALSYQTVGVPIGKMLLEDLKVCADDISDSNKKFCPVLIDEFGSFATPGFIQAAQLVRAKGIALHAFYQGFAALKDVSENFKEHVLTNSNYKIVFRQEVPADAEEWAKIAGTINSVNRSRQIGSDEFSSHQTGAGNERDVKEMRVEHDVFKELKNGQFVLIEKSQDTKNSVKLVSGMDGRVNPDKSFVRISTKPVRNAAANFEKSNKKRRPIVLN